MTQYPEVVLARELELCYVNIALITDYDAGLDGEGESGIRPVSVADVVRVLNDNNERVRRLIERLVPLVVGARSCDCPRALEHAIIS
jgi:5'-methylthioadenosine phosphorylase